ncbi:uncharacterized protein LOC118181782 [Stegodyphus dumicola]|uniref:uncharacterized protein LOC118181782 n=1 Tax=Stegodyphus dumicola TaxID=202533 RepID=UPI0015AECC38|nr:uncharacterized protein LOC118181782 [Stegodyphus dumicola]
MHGSSSAGEYRQLLAAFAEFNEEMNIRQESVQEDMKASQVEMRARKEVMEAGQEMIEAASTGLSIFYGIGDTPTFAGISGNSWIDLTLIISRDRIRIDNRKVTDEANNSDHNNIYFDVSSIHYSTWRRSKINVRHTDWLSFKRGVSKSLADPRNLKTIEEIDKYIREVTTSLHEIYQIRVLSHNSKPRPRTCPWWTKDLTILRKKVRATRKKFQKTTGQERAHNRLLYQRVRAQYRQKMYKEKKKAWDMTWNKITVSFPFGTYFDLVKGKSMDQLRIGSVQKDDCTMTSTTENTIREIMRLHFPEDDPNQDSTYHADIHAQSTEIPNSEDDQPFTLEEMQRTINSTCTGKAPGLDGLTIETIRRA